MGHYFREFVNCKKKKKRKKEKKTLITAFPLDKQLSNFALLGSVVCMSQFSSFVFIYCLLETTNIRPIVLV